MKSLISGTSNVSEGSMTIERDSSTNDIRVDTDSSVTTESDCVTGIENGDRGSPVASTSLDVSKTVSVVTSSDIINEVEATKSDVSGS